MLVGLGIGWPFGLNLNLTLPIGILIVYRLSRHEFPDFYRETPSFNCFVKKALDIVFY